MTTEAMIEECDFDEPFERRGTDSVKFDKLQERYGNPDLHSMWVADMDFASPACVRKAIAKKLSNPILGYTIEPADYKPAIQQWLLTQHQWEVKAEWLSYIPGIVKGIGFVINRFLKPGDKVIIQPPVYHPFRLVPEGNGIGVVFNPLKETKRGHYEMDFDNLEAVCDPQCKLLILSNPHNPAGIVWDKVTLQKLADICEKHHLLVISDEIHCDMCLWGNKHIPYATVSPKAAAHSITFGAPSKTFNIPGIVTSYAIVPNDALRQQFYGWLEANEFNDPNMLAPVATIACYRKGDSWRQQMLRTVEKRVMTVEDYCAAHISRIRPIRPQASFLIWLDCRDLHIPKAELGQRFIDAGLALNDGTMFGPGGEGFMRMNVGTTTTSLMKGLHLMEAAFGDTPMPENYL